MHHSGGCDAYISILLFLQQVEADFIPVFCGMKNFTQNIAQLLKKQSLILVSSCLLKSFEIRLV